MHDHDCARLGAELAPCSCNDRRHQLTDERLHAVRSAADHHRCCIAQVLREIAGDVLEGRWICIRDGGTRYELAAFERNHRFDGATLDGLCLSAVSRYRSPHRLR